MEIRDLLARGITLIVEPRGLKMSLDNFLSDYGGYLKNVVAVAKDTTGRVFYPSKIAPVDEEHPTFFTDFAEIAETLDIQFGAYVNVFADLFFAADTRFQTFNPRNEALDTLVCPNKPEFHDHMATILREIAAYPIQTLFLGSLGYARGDYCYCSDCRSEFTEYGELLHDFQIADPAVDSALYQKWMAWRTSKISDITKQLIAVAQEVKADLRVIPTFPVDSMSGYVDEANERFGLDLQGIAQVAKNVAVEAFPWTPVLPAPGSDDFNKYVDSLSFIPEFQKSGIEFVMTYWAFDDELEYDRAKALGAALEIEELYMWVDYPIGYRNIREARLGLEQ